MDLSWVTTFIAAAETGSFRRAADLLYISQPTVTVHIRQLEKETGASLFERGGRKVELTEEGRRYLEHCRKLMAVHQESLEDLQSISQGFTSSLNIAISPLVADTILPYVLKSYIKQHPEVEISVVIADSSDIEGAVSKGEVDIGLSCLPAADPQMISELLYNDRVMLVAGHDGRDSESAPPLDEEEVLLSAYLLTHNHPGYWDQLCREVKIRYPRVKMMRVSQTHITKRFIAEGLGVSFLPESTVRRELLEGRLLEVECRNIQLPEAAAYAIMRYSHSKQREFLSFLSNYRI
ncbi:LysR family transcriptional regulator [Bacillus infantis]|uniref:LysR family transcriptional regulator n=1 Tax=Bacillus infantis TaxID=324767 RepID=UPI003CFB8AAD